MIVAVEGPSAAGKTTWCRRHHAGQLIAEYTPTGAEPGDDDPAAQGRYWADVNGARWIAAVDEEQRSGLAICDSDPLKLHYSWCLAAVGAGTVDRWQAELAAVRNAMAQRRLGFADLILVTIPGPEMLRRNRDSDPSRRRRHFDLHARLADPLRKWYEAVDSLDPGRVRWELPAGGLAKNTLPARRPDRCGAVLLDSLVAALPALPVP